MSSHRCCRPGDPQACPRCTFVAAVRAFNNAAWVVLAAWPQDGDWAATAYPPSFATSFDEIPGELVEWLLALEGRVTQ